MFGYDPWGKRRSPDGRPATGTLNLQVGHREFTGHETIPEVGLINMNGRVYDPDLGRFLSGDPTVQFAANLQSYNRYSYILNNPLSFTDPSGFGRIQEPSVGKQLLMIGVGVAAEVGAIVVCVYTDGAGCAAAQGGAAAIMAATSARASGDSWGQTAEVGGIAFFQGFVMSGIGRGVSGAIGASGPAAGAASSVAIYSISTEVSGGSLGWRNILLAAAQGAAMGLASPADDSENPVSQASADRQGEQGDDGQSQGRSGQPERGRTDGIRAQEYQGTCVAADTRNAIVMRTKIGVTEDTIASKMDPEGTTDWDNKGIPMRAAVPVLKAYGLQAEQVNSPTLLDLTKAATDNNLAMVSLTNGESGFHAVLVVNSASAGTGQVFWVLDP